MNPPWGIPARSTSRARNSASDPGSIGSPPVGMSRERFDRDAMDTVEEVRSRVERRDLDAVRHLDDRRLATVEVERQDLPSVVLGEAAVDEELDRLRPGDRRRHVEVGLAGLASDLGDGRRTAPSRCPWRRASGRTAMSPQNASKSGWNMKIRPTAADADGPPASLGEEASAAGYVASCQASWSTEVGDSGVTALTISAIVA